MNLNCSFFYTAHYAPALCLASMLLFSKKWLIFCRSFCMLLHVFKVFLFCFLFVFFLVLLVWLYFELFKLLILLLVFLLIFSRLHF